VTVTDSANPERLQDQLHQAAGTARFVLGGDHPELVDGADLFFVSPGVPEENAVYRAAIDRGLPVQSMTTLFCVMPRSDRRYYGQQRKDHDHRPDWTHAPDRRP
jgi:UDP-N-acetylmuramoylalanine-D-glutamate ligase